MVDDAARRPRALERIAALALLALALALRVREALRTPLWYDELYTRAAVDRPWPDVMRSVRADVHPPLHFLLAHAWRVFGDSDLAVRASSLACALAAMAVGWALAREWFGRWPALLATLLLALHPWHVYLSQEARSYPLLWLGLAASTLGAWRWCERGRRRDAALFVLGSALALWTHYLAGVLLAVQAAWGAARLAREPRRLGAWALLHLAIAALFAPLVPLLLVQFRRVEVQHWMPVPRVADLVDTARRFAFGQPLAIVPVALLALAPLLAARDRRGATMALAIGPLAVLLCWALGTRGVRVFAFKYMMFALAPIYALVAAGACRLPGRLAGPLVALALVAVAARGLARSAVQPEAGGFGQARAYLAARARPGDTVFHADTHTLLFGRRYFPAQRHRLLLMGQPLPYYEGAGVVPDSVRGDAAEVAAARAAGAHWWAMAARPAGLDTRAASALFDSLAATPSRAMGVVRVWSGAPGR